MLSLLRHRASESALSPYLMISDSLWREILTELHARGGGERESGAFLLARKADDHASTIASATVVAAAYYDDLDAECLTGGISMSGVAYDVLWQRCREEKLRVVADVHTHPGDWIDQSRTDQANPMMALAGHLAVIVGRFADPAIIPTRIGLYRYLGAGKWQRLATRATACRDPRLTRRRRILDLVRWLRRKLPS